MYGTRLQVDSGTMSSYQLRVEASSVLYDALAADNDDDDAADADAADAVNPLCFFPTRTKNVAIQIPV